MFCPKCISYYKKRKNCMLKKLIFIAIWPLVLTSHAQVSLIENYLEGQGGIEGLEYPADMELDSSGNMYIVRNSAYLHLFMPESAKYASFVDLQNSIANPDLGNIDEIKTAPNHRFFYLVADNKLLLFAKKEGDDRLVHIKTVENNTSHDFGYSVFTDLSISPDGKNMYLAREMGTNQNSLKVFTIDSISGDITLKNNIVGVQNINNIVCNNQFVYTTSRGTNENSIRSYRRTVNDSLISVHKIDAADTLSQIKSMTLSADNRFLYVSDKNSVLLFECQSNGNLTFRDKIVISDFYDRFWNESTLTASADNKNLYLTDFIGVMVFKRDTLTGKISFIQSVLGDEDYNLFYSISALKITNNGSKVYVLSKYNNSIAVFDRDKTSGTLNYSSKIINGQKKIYGLTDATDIIISKNDRFLYTLAESGMNSIGFYKRGNDGKLEFEKNVTWHELGPEIGAVKDFQLSPDNESMYISSTNMYGIRILNRDTTTGDLTFYKSYTDSGIGLTDEVISEFVIPSDGKNLYTATHNYLINYEIDKENTDLKFVTKLPTDGKMGNGIPGSKKIIASNDGRNIYTFSNSMDFVSGISVYSRAEDGSIHHVENLTSYQFSFMVDRPFSLAISHDDKYLYAAGTSLFCFKRNTENGKLTFVFEVKYDDLDIENLCQLNHITISRDGKFLLAVSCEKKTILSFYRFSTSGELILKQKAHYSIDHNCASMSPFSMFSNDMKNVYIASPIDGSLGVYDASIPLSLTKISDFCAGDTAKITVDEGYNYFWSNGETQNKLKTTIPGEYSIQVTDNLGRKGADTTNVVFHDQPKFSLSIADWGSDDSTTMINSHISNGSFPFNYLWNDGSTLEFIMVKNPDSLNPKKDLSLTVTDKYGCFSSDSISLIYTISEEDYLKEEDRISIYPNPFNQFIYISLVQPYYSNISVRVSNIDGKELLKLNRVGVQSCHLDLSILKSGLYILEVTNNKSVKREKIIKL